MAAATHNQAYDLAQITPVVLVGGRSRRYGRDKLREPVGGGDHWLVDRPLGALREVFGPRVAAVGACDPEVAGRFDRIIEDRHPGAGPIGGIISALAAAGGPVFVLAGDLAAVTGEEVGAVVEVWVRSSGRPSPAGCKPAPPGLAPAGCRPAPPGAAPAGCKPAPPGLAPAGCKPAPRGAAPAGCKPAPPGAGAALPLAVMARTDRPEPCCALYTAEALPILQARLARGERSLHDALPADRVELVPLPRERLANINTPGDLSGGRREV